MNKNTPLGALLGFLYWRQAKITRMITTSPTPPTTPPIMAHLLLEPPSYQRVYISS
jgi:hypothetical protein